MAEAARACSNQRRTLIGSWVTPPPAKSSKGVTKTQQSTTATGGTTTATGGTMTATMGGTMMAPFADVFADLAAPALPDVTAAMRRLATDIHEDEKSIVIKADVPGM